MVCELLVFPRNVFNLTTGILQAKEANKTGCNIECPSAVEEASVAISFVPIRREHLA